MTMKDKLQRAVEVAKTNLDNIKEDVRNLCATGEEYLCAYKDFKDAEAALAAFEGGEDDE